VSPPRPHDLLRLSAAHRPPPDVPAWAAAALNVTPWVVVRRSATESGLIPVGVRGTTRSERYAMEMEPSDVREVVAPEDLAHAAPGRDLAAMTTLQTVRPLLDGTGLAWGPTGSVGFELATGLHTATAESDLDLVVRVPGGLADVLPALAAVHDGLRHLAARVDCQVETDWGAVALAELIGDQSDVMVRTVRGPRLIRRAVAVS